MIKRAFHGTPAYPLLRNTYQRTFNRPYWKQRQQIAAFFSQFVAAGDLVFDVGANVGEYTEMFVSLGARVVSVEPNPQLLPVLATIRPANRVYVETAAIGAQEGSAELLLCGRDYLATLSKEWVKAAENSERFSGIKWEEKITVPVTTLDALIQKHGQPKFIKIDVEGFENQVLAGLSKAPQFLSFEANPEFASMAIDCIGQKCLGSNSLFNFTLGLTGQFVFPTWVSRSQLEDYLRSPDYLQKKLHGDVLVRTDS